MSLETEKSKLVPTEQIQKDIEDTLVEVQILERRLSLTEAIVSHFKTEIEERMKFVNRLRDLVEERNNG